MKKYLNFKYVLSIISIVALLLVIAVIVLNFKNTTNTTNPSLISEQRLTTVSDLEKFLATTSLPLKNTKVERITETIKDYVVKAAINGNIDNPVSFEINGGKIAFTSIGNPNLGVMNTSVLKKQDGKIIYNNIYNGINLIYTPSSQGILEEYEVRAKRNIDYLIQKIDLSNLTYKKQDDGSILFYNQKQEFAFAIPKPVMYEEFNTKNRNFGLHYEIFEYQGNTYLAKVIDASGKDWLAKSNYPVMIDATILLTLFSYRSYPTVNNNWQIGIQTVGSGDLKILPSQGTTLSLENDSSKDLNSLTLTCGGKKIDYQTIENGVLFPNFSCDSDIIVKTTVIDPNKQNNLDFTYSDIRTTVSSFVDTGKPVIVSSSVNPAVVKVGDTLTITAEIADKKGITSVTADMGGVETIDLKLTSGTVKNGVWKADWKVHGTGTKTYRILISASNGTDITQGSIGFFDPYTCTGGGDHAGADWNPATDCAGGFAGDHTNIGTLSVNNGQTATVQAYNGSSFGYASTSAAITTIAGTVTANTKGFTSGTGPGAGGASGANKGGGAGYGGRGNSVSGSAGTFYGSLSSPTDKGSGGGTGIGQAGGTGGGAIMINTTGTFTFSGSITSNGGAGTGCGGGGSGGTVYIIAGTITGAGSISANGGAGGGSCSTGGHGAGGRVAVYYTTTNSYSGTITVSLGGTGAEYGTSLIKGSSTGDFIIPSINSRWFGSDLTSWVFHDLTINGTINFVATSATLITITATGSSSFASGITITTTGSYTTNANGAGVSFDLSGDVTIPSTTSITASGLGYAGGTGSGAGAGTGGGGGAGGNSGGGGGHGGRGANGSASGGSAYDSLTQPIDLGSGGGSGIGNAGGAGGGAIKIKTTGTLTVSGSIVSNGSNGSGCGAGGAGGSIYLDTQQIRGGGTITAIGGNGGGSCSSPGGGGGGRIALYCSGGYNWTGTALTAANIATKGTGGSSGANGTVYNQGCSLVNTSINGTTTIGGSVRIQ